MFWQAGDKTYLIHTSQWARFSRYLDGEMVMVILDDETEEIPVHLDDIDYREPETARNQTIHPTPQKPARDQVVTRPSGTFTGSGSGMYLGIVVDPDDQPNRLFHVLLVNDTDHVASCQLVLQSEGSVPVVSEGEARGHSWTELGAYSVDRLHHQPTLRMTSWEKQGLRQIARPETILRPRPKSLFKRITLTRFHPSPIALFPLPEQSAQVKTPALPVHTRPSPSRTEGRRRIAIVPTPEERAAFDIELDLHAEAFLPNPAKMTEAEIFLQQMRRFENYLRQAIRLGVPHVFIIHGLGKGKLKRAIAERCQSYPEVTRVTNHHHPKYGFGASEIIFG